MSAEHEPLAKTQWIDPARRFARELPLDDPRRAAALGRLNDAERHLAEYLAAMADAERALEG